MQQENTLSNEKIFAVGEEILEILGLEKVNIHCQKMCVK